MGYNDYVVVFTISIQLNSFFDTARAQHIDIDIGSKLTIQFE